MAHECPDCAVLCYCGYDIDDLLLNTEEAVVNCSHCFSRIERENEGDWEPVETDPYEEVAR